jgi:DNA-binding transcriptional MerR regulator
MSHYYSTKEAAGLTGASRQSIRTYTSTYQRYFSTEGAPELPGQPRRFTADDLKLIRYIYTSTKEQSLTHEQILQRLASGALAEYDWLPPEPQSPYSSAEHPESAGTALVPVERLQAAHALLAEAQRREAETAEQIQALQDRLLATERELGRAQGELQAHKANRRQAPKWWRALFGGTES